MFGGLGRIEGAILFGIFTLGKYSATYMCYKNKQVFTSKQITPLMVWVNPSNPANRTSLREQNNTSSCDQEKNQYIAD